MKKTISISLFLISFFALTSCQSQCQRCQWIKRNPVTPKDQYYQEYYESAPLASLEKDSCYNPSFF